MHDWLIRPWDLVCFWYCTQPFDNVILILITNDTLFELISGHAMKINNITAQLQLGESLIRFYTEQSSESQGFEGKTLHALCQLGQDVLATCSSWRISVFEVRVSLQLLSNSC